MLRITLCLLFSILFLCSPLSFARQSGGGDDLKGVCELAGGTWTGREGGNWACCWDNWGCYGCYHGICKMQCRTQRCKDANKIRKSTAGTRTLKGLAPKGLMAPVVPMKNKSKKLSH